MPRKVSKRKRIGIFGGTFNPIHNGHLYCAEKVRQALSLDRVEFVVSASPPNKKTGVLEAEHRYEMVATATASNKHFFASRVDMEHRGMGYSLLTVEAYKEIYPDAEFFYLLSGEYLDPNGRWYLADWIGAKEIFKLCTFAVFPREDQKVEQIRKWAKEIRGARFEIVGLSSPPISSTLVRAKVGSSESISNMVPSTVAKIIAKEGHYIPETDTDTDTDKGIMRILGSKEKVKKLAIFEGAFNSANNDREIELAEFARGKFKLDQVLFVPALRLPNRKRSKAKFKAEASYTRLLSETAAHKSFRCSRQAIDRNTTSYALLTVEEIRQKLGDDVEIYLIVSSKYLNPNNNWHISRWMGAEELFKQVCFLVYPENDGVSQEHINELAAKIKGARIQVISESKPDNRMPEKVERG